MAFIAETEKLTLKFMWNFKSPQIAKTILKKYKVGGLTSQNLLQSYYNQNSVYLHKDRHIDKWNRTESLEINP